LRYWTIWETISGKILEGFGSFWDFFLPLLCARWSKKPVAVSSVWNTAVFPSEKHIVLKQADDSRCYFVGAENRADFGKTPPQ